MRILRRTNRGTSRRGQSLVEFALILPVFLLIVMGLFDFGRAVMYYNTMSNAARQGARVAIVDPTVTNVQQAAVNLARSTMPLATADVTVVFLNETKTGTCSPSVRIGCIARVTVDHRFQPATPFAWAIDMSATTELPVEDIP